MTPRINGINFFIRTILDKLKLLSTQLVKKMLIAFIMIDLN